MKKMMIILILMSLCMIFLMSSCVIPPPTTNTTSGSSYYNSGGQCQDVVISCGCHGYVTFGQTEYTNRCNSGYHEAVPCYNMGSCPRGGQPWGTRCTC